MTAKDLETEFGRCIPDNELAKYLGVDVRTVRKYAAGLGGVMVMPGKYIFFKKVLKEKIKNAEPNHEKRCPPVPSKCSNSGKTRKEETKALSGRQQKNVQKNSLMGGGNQETVKRGNEARSRHGVF
jgi:hypothetical protein